MQKSFSEVTPNRIVAMAEWCGMQIIATEHDVYAISKTGTLELLKFEVLDGKGDEPK